MNTWQFYATSDLPILGGTEYDYPAKFNALMAAIQAYFEERQSFLTGCFTAPTLGQSSLQVTITDLLALVGGVGVSGSDFVDFTGKGAGTYTVQVDDAGVVTATLSPSAAQIPLCTQVWTGSAFTGAPTPAFVLLSDILHNRQHSIVSDDDHTFPGGTTAYVAYQCFER